MKRLIHRSVIMALLLSVQYAAYASVCVRAGTDLNGRLEIGTHSHPNGTSFEIFTLALVKKSCFEFNNKTKSEDQSEIQINPSDKDRIAFKRLNHNEILIDVKEYFPEETAWHVRPVVANESKISAVFATSSCEPKFHFKDTLQFKGKDVYQVANRGRSPLYSDATPECKSSLFLVSGDRVRLLTTKDRYGWVEYISQKDNIKYFGWIEERHIKK